MLLHRKQLSAYLEYGEAAITNNICERAIRNFTIGRKNRLFSASPICK
ncbi:transposase [uncultured Acidaminococcus sp.]